jgi:hypothetical protein
MGLQTLQVWVKMSSMTYSCVAAIQNLKGEKMSNSLAWQFVRTAIIMDIIYLHFILGSSESQWQAVSNA